MAKSVVHEVNDAHDAICDARAMVWAMFYMAQGMRQDEISDALTACCNQALVRLRAGADTLDALAAEERAKAGI